MITLCFIRCSDNHHTDVSFATDDQAIAYIEKHSSTHAIAEDHNADENEKVISLFPKTYDVLYPRCEHGLSEWLCAGPGHYPADNPY